jgi:hypothetical protein
MTATESYNGYVIKAVAIPLRDGAFTAHGSIIKHRGFATDDTPFQTGERHATEDAALRAGVGWARKKIDRTF